MPDIYWEDIDNITGERPANLQEFLAKVGKPVFKVMVGNQWVYRSYRVPLNTLNDSVSEHIVNKFDKKRVRNVDVWYNMSAKMLSYGTDGWLRYKIVFDHLELNKDSIFKAEYKAKPDGTGNALYVSLADELWVDAPDIVLLDRVESVREEALKYISENIFDVASPFSGGDYSEEVLPADKVRFTVDPGDRYVIHVKALVRVKDDGNKLLKHEFRYPKAIRHYSSTIAGQKNTYVQMADAKVTINWQHDYQGRDGYRPDLVNVELRDDFITSAPNPIYLTIYGMEDHKSENQWEKVFADALPVINPKTRSKLFYYNDNIYADKLNYYLTEDCKLSRSDYPEIVCPTEYNITVTYDQFQHDFFDIRGRGIWIDGDLSIDHSQTDKDVIINVIRNGQAMTPAASKLVLSLRQTDFTYAFSESTDFPAKDADGKWINYSIMPGEKDGYILTGYGSSPYDFAYVRKVSISGYVTWQDGKVPDANVRPTVTLLRYGEPVGEPVKCDENYHYSFDEWPAASEKNPNESYVYSIRVDMPETARCVIIYHEPETDAKGNVTANAQLRPVTQNVFAEIPVKLTLKDAPELEPDDFDFELTCLEDDRLSCMITLNRDNNFEGTFVTSALPDHNKTYTFQISQSVINEKPCWTYDRHVVKATASVRYIDGTAAGAVVEIVEGETDENGKVLFENIYHAEDGVLALTAKKEIESEAGTAEIPETDFAYLLEAVLDDGTCESVAKVYHTSDGDIVFPRLAYQKTGTYKYLISEPKKDIPGWKYDPNKYPVTVTVTDQNGKLVATADSVPVFKNIFAYLAQNVNVSVNWIDEGSKRRPSQMQIQLTANGKPEPDRNVTLKASENWAYTFLNLPTNIGQKAIYYGVDVVVPSGYSARVTGNAVEGFVINCTAMIEVIGTVDWENKDRPTDTQPIIQLTRNEMPYDLLLAAKDYKYTFTNLPIADENNQPYRYAITATLSGYPCAIFYDQPKQDPYTGFVQADAIIRKILGTGKVKLNKKIDNKMAGIAQPPEETYTFQMEEVQSDGSRALVSTVSITGEGTVEFPEMAFMKTGNINLILSETSEEKAGWIYDKKEYPVKLSVSFKEDELVVEQNTVPTITNTFVTTMTEVPVKVVWNIGSDNCTVPDSVDLTLRSDSGEELKATVSAAQEWSYTFTNVKQYRLNGETLKPIQYTLFATEAQGFKQFMSDSLGVCQVTYTQNTRIDIPVFAEWIVTASSEDDLPDALNVTLKDITNSKEGETVAKLILFKSNGWKDAFHDIEEFCQPVSPDNIPVARKFTLEVEAVDLFQSDIEEEDGGFHIWMNEGPHAGIEDITQPEYNALNAQIIGDLSPFLEKGEERYLVRVWLEAKQLYGLTDAENTAARGVLAKKEKILAMLDITAWKQVTNRSSNNGEQQMHQLPGGEISVQVDMPMPNANDSKMLFDVIRIHNGKAERIPCTQDHVRRTIAFLSDKFSTYVITGRKIPKTGDDINLPLTVGMLMLSLSALVVLMRKRKTF